MSASASLFDQFFGLSHPFGMPYQAPIYSALNQANLAALARYQAPSRPMLLGDLDDENVWWDQLEWAPGPREMAYGDL